MFCTIVLELNIIKTVPLVWRIVNMSQIKKQVEFSMVED